MGSPRASRPGVRVAQPSQHLLHCPRGESSRSDSSVWVVGEDQVVG